MYRTAGRHPTTWHDMRHYGPVAVGRFDHQPPPPHDDPDRGILYGALDGPAAVVESFQDSRLIDRFRDAPWLLAFDLGAAVTALDLRGAWPTRAGASQAIATGRRDTAQAWSRAIYEAYRTVAALIYASSMAGGSSNVVLYDRAKGALPRDPVAHVPLSHPGLEVALSRVAERSGYDLR